LTSSLCDAITGRTDSASLLEQLERANLFLLPLDGAQQWYRYHALFAEAMQHYARRRLGEARLRALYDQASLWYEQHGFLGDAVETSLSSQDFSRAARLMEQAITPHLANNEEQRTKQSRCAPFLESFRG
jgi:LuxR family transcriptional regulator, maltose regulon positive regulatory protein